MSVPGYRDRNRLFNETDPFVPLKSVLRLIGYEYYLFTLYERRGDQRIIVPVPT